MKHKQNLDYGLCGKILCVLALFTPMIPLLCGYILEGQQLPPQLLDAQGNAYGRYVFSMLLIHVLTFLSNCMFYHRFCDGAKKRLCGSLGVFLYMTCPYHIYLCYDKGDLLKTVIGILLPIAGWSFLGILQKKKVVLNGLVFIIVFAGIFWVNMHEFSVQWGVDNYSFADLLSCWNYRDGKPGIGLGILVALTVELWIWFVVEKKDGLKNVRGIIVCVLVLCLLCTNMTQLLGCVTWLLCVESSHVAWKPDGDSLSARTKGVLLLIVMAALATCLYQCNTLTHTRMPLNLS